MLSEYGVASLSKMDLDPESIVFLLCCVDNVWRVKVSAFVCVCARFRTWISRGRSRRKSSLGGDLLRVFSVALAVMLLGQAPSLTGSITPHPHKERDFLIFSGKALVHGVSLETLWWAVSLSTRRPCCRQNSLGSGNFSSIEFIASYYNFWSLIYVLGEKNP